MSPNYTRADIYLTVESITSIVRVKNAGSIAKPKRQFDQSVRFMMRSEGGFVLFCHVNFSLSVSAVSLLGGKAAASRRTSMQLSI